MRLTQGVGRRHSPPGTPHSTPRWRRIKYEQCIQDVKNAVSKKTGVPVEKMQLFWQGRELTPAYDKKTLLEMNLHTGFSLQGYDLVSMYEGG